MVVLEEGGDVVGVEKGWVMGEDAHVDGGPCLDGLVALPYSTKD